MKAYSAVLVVLISVMVGLFAVRSDVEATLLRTPGVLYQERDEAHISNMYNYKLVNKTNDEMPIEFRTLRPTGQVELIGKSILLGSADLSEGELFIVLDRKDLEGMKTEVVVGVFSGDRLIEELSTSFVGPMPGK